MGLPNSSREAKFSGANGDREMSIFPVQLTTSRIGNLTRLIFLLLYVMTIHTPKIHSSLYESYTRLFFLNPTVCTARCALLTFASLYPLMMLVISRMYSVREYAVLIVDPIAGYYCCNAQPLSIFRFAKSLAFVSTHVPSSPSYTELNKSAPTSRAFAGINSLLHRHPAGYGAVRI